MTAAEWNAIHPVGTPVIWYPYRDSFADARHTKTRSEAWELGGGTAVVLVEGRTGGKPLWSIAVDAQEARTDVA